MQDSPSKSLLSPDFIFHLNQYYQKPFKWTVFSKDALTNQRISSGKWHKKMHEHLLKYTSCAWKKSMERRYHYFKNNDS